MSEITLTKDKPVTLNLESDAQNLHIEYSTAKGEKDSTKITVVVSNEYNDDINILEIYHHEGDVYLELVK